MVSWCLVLCRVCGRLTVPREITPHQAQGAQGCAEGALSPGVREDNRRREKPGKPRTPVDMVRQPCHMRRGRLYTRDSESEGQVSGQGTRTEDTCPDS